MPQFETSSSSSSFVEVSSCTWSKDTHNLFDFEASEANLHNKTFSVREPIVFVRNQHEVDMISSGAAASVSSSDKLLQLTRDHRGRFALQRPRLGGGDERKMRCWRLIREKEGTEHKLTQGDIIKFGRSQFRVRQLSLNEASNTALDLNCTAPPCSVDPNAQHSADQPCRICLSNESSPEDPLLAPCNCKGSVQNIHLGCMRQWVRDRVGLGDGDKAFVYNDLTCELCKSPYQLTIKTGTESVSLIDVSSPFIILESVTDGRLFVLPFKDGNSIKIGRGHECDMNVHDTSISRLQANIDFEDGQFLLRDSGSRFGTFVKVIKPFALEDGTPIMIQVGRTVLRLSSKLATANFSDDTCEDFYSAISSAQGDDDDLEHLETERLKEPSSCSPEIHDVTMPWSSEFVDSYQRCE
jgi:hypothetical protein